MKYSIISSRFCERHSFNDAIYWSIGDSIYWYRANISVNRQLIKIENHFSYWGGCAPLQIICSAGLLFYTCSPLLIYLSIYLSIPFSVAYLWCSLMASICTSLSRGCPEEELLLVRVWCILLWGSAEAARGRCFSRTSVPGALSIKTIA